MVAIFFPLKFDFLNSLAGPSSDTIRSAYSREVSSHICVPLSFISSLSGDGDSDGDVIQLFESIFDFTPLVFLLISRTKELEDC